jgi:hypothetical protein
VTVVDVTCGDDEADGALDGAASLPQPARARAAADVTTTAPSTPWEERERVRERTEIRKPMRVPPLALPRSGLRV